MHCSPIAGALGAEVTGIDLRTPIAPALAAQLRDALTLHQVLFFRDQAIAPAHHRALAEVFGEPQPHPAYPTIEGFPELSILEVDEQSPPTIDTWHTDMTFMESPPLGSILHGVIIPPFGGDTLFASLTRAYETLAAPLKEALEGLEAIHSFAHGFRHSLASPDAEKRKRVQAAAEANPPVRHPLVCRHPESGKKMLYVNALFTTQIIGMPEAQSDALLRLLYAHITEPEHTCRFRWQPHSIAIWDNRATQHRPINDFWPGHRRMQRITIAGEPPRG